ncbi:DUF1748-domain-containing protein [Atractiella rhizophila]|nr:DUF1748-domain-containing protein [Atractiella rhizophila]
MLGRLVHYGVDAVMLTTILAGIKRTSGFQLSTNPFPEGTPRNFANQYLGIGEKIFDMACAASFTSGWFEKSEGKPRQ